jgi:EAL domain-containing protein (putative c-di-GMP-specific phosphodiesterase class I)
VHEHHVPTGLPLVSVNLSTRQLREPYVTERLRHSLADAQLDPSRLCIELTEDTLATDVIAATRVLTELKAAGVRIALDDFGSLSSTLATLRQFPFDVVKLDRSAVAVLTDDPITRAVDRAVIDLGGELGMTVVAKGVETPAQREVLQDLGCPLAQGHLFSAPVAASEVDLLLGHRLGAA